jgi:Dynamin GTPase effector domain
MLLGCVMYFACFTCRSIIQRESCIMSLSLPSTSMLLYLLFCSMFSMTSFFPSNDSCQSRKCKIFLNDMLFCVCFRESLFEEMLKEPDEISTKRKHIRETLKVLQQAYRVMSLCLVFNRFAS